MHWRRNGNPLQYSCLEDPRDGGAWWAAIYGVAQSRTRLKRLSRFKYKHTRNLVNRWTEFLSPLIFFILWQKLLLFRPSLCCCVHACSAIPWAVAQQGPLFMRFPRQEYWRGLPFPPLGDLPNAGMKPKSPLLHWQADSLPLHYMGRLAHSSLSFSYFITLKLIVTTGYWSCARQVQNILWALSPLYIMPWNFSLKNALPFL